MTTVFFVVRGYIRLKPLHKKLTRRDVIILETNTEQLTDLPQVGDEYLLDDYEEKMPTKRWYTVKKREFTDTHVTIIFSPVNHLK